MMTCKQLTELLLHFLDGDLPKEDMDLIGHHLRDCPPCVHFLDSYQLTIKLSRQLPPLSVPQELKQRLQLAAQQIEARRTAE